MKRISEARLKTYRNQTFRAARVRRITTRAAAVRFVKERKFIFFWPIKGIVMPSLWNAVVGMRGVPVNHDDPGHVTWGWKDGLLGKRKWYYAKVLRGRSTIISLDTAPYFLALTKNYGDPDLDCRMLFQAGLLSPEARTIYEALIDQGAVDTYNLRGMVHMADRQFSSVFDRALNELMRNFKILPVGIAPTGRWKYSFIYDLTSRFHPELIEQAQEIPEERAFARLAEYYFASVGAATAGETWKVFHWPRPRTEQVLAGLAEDKIIYPGYSRADTRDECFVYRELVPARER